MSDQPYNEEQRRDQLLLRLLKTPSQPRPQLDRGKEVSQLKARSRIARGADLGSE